MVWIGWVGLGLYYRVRSLVAVNGCMLDLLGFAWCSCYGDVDGLNGGEGK